MGKDKRRVQMNRARKLARKEARRRQRKRAQASAGTNRFAELGCTRAELERAPIHRCFVSKTIDENGIGHVIISRVLPDGRVAAGVFLVDAYCLGVKDAFFTVRSPAEFDEGIATRFESQRLEPVAPAHARKLIQDAITYARNLGFEPHEDFCDASVVLGDIDPTACDVVFTFGKDGKPFYVSGPNESEERALQIVNQLITRCGKDGFHYLVKVHGPDDDEEELDIDEDDIEEDGEDSDEVSPQTDERG